MYYHNNRVLQHGNLTGMISFQCSTPWSDIKKPTSSFFQWLRQVRVYLNQTKFKASTLVACGFLYGAHPGYLRCNEAEKELSLCLNNNHKEKNYFQWSARTLSVPITDGKPERFLFQAIVIETEAKQAFLLRERFYSLGDPLKVKQVYQYVAKYQFDPLVMSKEWSVEKIFASQNFMTASSMNYRPVSWVLSLFLPH
jgi:hypothetical protein